jgi:hypothetical protein
MTVRSREPSGCGSCFPYKESILSFILFFIGFT